MPDQQKSRWLPSPPEGTPHWLVEAIQRAFKFIYALQDIIGSSSSISVLEGLHTDRLLSTNAADKYSLGSMFIETDRGDTVYIDAKYNSVPTWIWLSGNWYSLWADRPTDLGITDAGFLFTATDRGITERWDGTTWIWVSGVQRDVFANIPGKTGSANAALSAGEVGYLFYATDTTILWRWTGTQWQYMEGVEPSTQSTIPDVAGYAPGGMWIVDRYQTYTVDHLHLYQYDSGSSIWRFAPGDAGTRWIVAVPSNASPFGGVWAACDGSGATIAIDGFASGGTSTQSVTTPILNQGGSEPVAIFGSNSPSAVTAATSPTWDPSHHLTEDENGNHAHEEVFTPATIHDGGGGAFTVALAVTGDFTHVENAVHQHELNNTNAKLNPPSAADGGLPKHISLQWWMRA